MSKSHGMSEARWVRDEFYRDFEQYSPHEKKQFLSDTMNDFSMLMTYRSKDRVVSIADIVRAHEALKLFAQILYKLPANPTSRDVALMETTLAALNQVPESERNDLDLQDVISAIKKCSEKSKSNIPVDRSQSADPLNARPQRSDSELLPDYMDASVIRVVFQKQQPNNVSLYIFPGVANNNAFKRSLKSVARRLAYDESARNANNMLNNHSIRYAALHSQEDIQRELGFLLGKILDESVRMLGQARKLFSSTNNHKYIRTRTLQFAGNIERNTQDIAGFPRELFVQHAPKYMEFIQSQNFSEIAYGICSSYFSEHHGQKLFRLQNLFDIAHSDNPDVALIAASTYIVQAHSLDKVDSYTELVNQQMEQVITDGFNSRILERKVTQDPLTWGDVVKQASDLVRLRRDTPIREIHIKSGLPLDK